MQPNKIMRKKSLTFSFRYLLLFFSVLGFASCVAEKDQITKEPKGSDAMVYLKVRTSKAHFPDPKQKHKLWMKKSSRTSTFWYSIMPISSST